MSTPSNWPLSPDGVRYIVPRRLVDHLRGNPLTADLYPTAFGYYPRAAGHRVHRREHDDHLLIYCVGGQALLQAGGQAQTVGAGQIVALPQGMPHHYLADADDPWTVYWVHFDGTRAGEFLRHALAEPGRTVADVGVLAKAVADFDTLLGCRRSAHQQAAFVHAANHLKQLICYFGVPRPRRRDHDLLDRVHALMHERLHRGVTLDDLAAAAGLSRYHFSRWYRGLTGAPPMARFTQLRMSRACHLLDAVDGPVATIAADLGFDDPFYFSRQFRKVVGLSPTDYRNLRHG